MKVFIVIAVLIAATCAAPSVKDNKIESDSTFSTAARLFGNCFDSEDMTTCLAIKGITALNRAARSNNIEIVPGVTFTRDPSSSMRSGKSLSENDIVGSLPADSEDRNGRLMDMALESAVEFFGTHNLEMKVPAEATQNLARAIDEGRGKMKKLMGPLAMAVAAKLVALVPILLGGLALLATKALIVAKIAFILAITVGASKLFGSGGLGGKLGGLGGALGGYGSGYNANSGWQSGNQGWSSGVSSYPYARSLGDAQEIAYQGQMPATQ